MMMLVFAGMVSPQEMVTRAGGLGRMNRAPYVYDGVSGGPKCLVEGADLLC